MEEFKVLLNKAIKEREQGNLNEAEKMFLEILNIFGGKLLPWQTAAVYNHLGLTYFLMGIGHHHQSFEYFTKIQQIKIEGDIRLLCDERISSHRNLSRPQFAQFHEDGYRSCMYLANEAYRLAACSKRQDLVWFTHGIIQVRIAAGCLNKTTRRLFWQEVREYLTLGRKSKDNLAKNAWKSGIYGDFLRIFFGNNVPMFVLEFTKKYLDKHGMPRRAEQVKGLIDKRKTDR